jgi:hypothetical protein
MNRSSQSIADRMARARRIAAPLAALCLAVSGCGGQMSTPVDPSRAREALRTALEGWKKGDAPGALQGASPPITVQDMDWLAGAKLVDYQVDGDGKPVEANLYVPVKLTLRTPKGKEVRKKVNYVVGTSPILTVFRDFR